jgi:pimeloyl-ACP methyl ester carboxylesterase
MASPRRNLPGRDYPTAYSEPGSAINRPIIVSRYTPGMTTPCHQAVLVTGATETHYRRAGAGRPLLLLFPCGPADSLGNQLLERLATHCRVIAPVRPVGVPLSRWLRDLIDGLGLDRPYLVADQSIAGVALGFALMEHERVGGVVAVCRDYPDPLRPAALEDRLVQSAHRLLVVPLDPAADASTAAVQILAFIDSPERRP